jgi:hypothetical protein
LFCCYCFFFGDVFHAQLALWFWHYIVCSRFRGESLVAAAGSSSCLQIFCCASRRLF